MLAPGVGRLADAHQCLAQTMSDAGNLVAPIAFFGGWIASGFAVATVMSSRGHDLRLWAALGAGLGPMSVIMARHTRTSWSPDHVIALRPGTSRHGDLDVLVDATAAPTVVVAGVRQLANDLGPRLGRIALVDAVPDCCFEQPRRLHPAEVARMCNLEKLAEHLTEFDPATLITTDRRAAMPLLALHRGYHALATDNADMSETVAAVTRAPWRLAVLDLDPMPPSRPPRNP